MNRREFLKAGTAVTAAGVVASAESGPTAGAAPAESHTTTTPAVVKDYTAQEHRRRLENIALCERGIRKCIRKHLITSYLAGACRYNLGEYPCRKPWDPDEWDEQELDKLRDHGIQMVRVHEEWNDSQRLFGSHKLAPLNPAGFRRFVNMVHRRGMKLIVYASTGYFERTDPDFRREWAREPDNVALHYRYAHCSPASAGWRAYFLPRLFRIFDEYGVDGIYNDLGYRSLASHRSPPTADEVLAFEETATHDGALTDLLSLIYDEIHRRGGIVKLHYGGAKRPLSGDVKVYDYLWVGEYMKSADKLREAVKDFPPYVTQGLDMSTGHVANEDELYLHAIPYMQMPVLHAGRPFTGQRAAIPGIKYNDDGSTRRVREIWKFYQAHPEGPYTYSWMDSCPGRPEARPTHARWLKQYLPMVAEGTLAYLEISDSNLFRAPLPQHVVASAFAGRDLYLVLANYGQTPVEVATSASYVPAADPSASPRNRWELEQRSLHILRSSGA